jgi:hypothetical protein
MPYSFLGIFFLAFFFYGSFEITSSKFAPNITRDGTLDKRGPFPFSITNSETSIYVGFGTKVDDACVDVCVLVLGVLGIAKVEEK